MLRIALLAMAPLAVQALPISLWAVSESAPAGKSGPRLYGFSNYGEPGGRAVDFGQLVWTNNGVTASFAGGAETNLESMAVDSRTGQAWMIVNPASGGFASPQLFTLNLQTVMPSAQVEVTHLGSMQGGAVEALAFNELTGVLYGIRARSGAEELITVNPLNGATSAVGLISGTPSGVAYMLTQTDGLEFVHRYDSAGRPAGTALYGYDQTDNHLYAIDMNTAAIMALVNSAAASATDIETIAWDSRREQMIGLDNAGAMLHQISLTGNSVTQVASYAQNGLPAGTAQTDLEGAAFYYREVNEEVPEPGTWLTIGAGLLAIAVVARRG